MPGKSKNKRINLASRKIKKSNMTSFRLFQLFFYFVAILRIFLVGNKEYTLGLSGADAQTVNTNNNTWQNFLFYINKNNQFSVPLKDIFGINNLTVNQIQNLDGSISSAFSLSPVGSYPISNYALSIAVSNTLALLLSDLGLQIVDFSNPVTPLLKGSYNLPSTAINLAVNGTLAYVVDWISGLKIIDFSNPAFPVLRGQCILPSGIYPYGDVAISGNLALIAYGNLGLQIINISNSTNPQLIGSLSIGGSADNIAVSGNIAVIADDTSGTKIIDFSNPSSPIIKSSISAPSPGQNMGVAVSGTLAFVASWGATVQIIDFSNPSSPSIKATYPTSMARHIATNGNLAFIADFTAGLQIVDFSNPSSPTLNGVFNTYGQAYDVAIGLSQVVIADYVSGLQIIDPSFLSFSKTPVLSDRGVYFLNLKLNQNVNSSTHFKVVVSENVIVKSKKTSDVLTLTDYGHFFSTSFYAGDLFQYYGFGCFLSMTLKNGSPIPSWLSLNQPQITGIYSATNQNYYDVAISGTLALVADGFSGVRIIDISNPIMPTLKGTVLTTGFSESLSVSGNIVFVATSIAVQAIDFSNPNSPVVLGTYNMSPYAFDVAVVGNLVLVANNNNGGTPGFQIISFSNPSNPTFVGTYSTVGPTMGIAVSNNFAFMACETGGLQIIDFSNPANPILKATYPLQQALNVAVIGTLAFVTDGSAGLFIIDFSNFSSLVLKGVYKTAGQAKDIVINQYLAFVTSSGYGLEIIDFSNLPNIVLRASFQTAGQQGFGIAVSGTIIAIADGTAGLKVIDFSQGFYSITGMPNATVAGNYEFSIIGTNDLGLSAQSFYSLSVQGAPIANSTMPIQIAFSGQTFSAIVSQGVFYDPNGDALTFSAALLSGAQLPHWLQFSPTGVFLGTPQSSDVGNSTVVVTASDGNGGSASINVQFMVSNLPLVALPISNQLANINQNFIFTMPAGIFVSRDGGTLNYFAKQNNGLPLSSTWVSFNSVTQTFSGAPSTNSRISVDLSATSTSTGGQVHTYFDIIAEHFPQSQKSIPNVLAAIGIPLDILMPSALFVDADGDSMTYRAFVIVNNAPSPLPSWLSFSTFNVEFGEFTGTPPAGSTGVLPIQIIATDSQGGQGSAYFNITLDYFPILNSKYTLSNQVIPVGQAWSFVIPPDLFVDQDDSISSLIVSVNSNFNNTFFNSSVPNSNTSTSSNSSSITNIICSSLIYWMNCQNTTIYGTPDVMGIIPISINATDPKGGITSISFIVAADIFPTVQESVRAQIKSIVAPIGNGFYYQLPQNIFNYSGPGILSYQANQVTNSQRKALYEQHERLLYPSHAYHPWYTTRKVLSVSGSNNLLPLPNFLSFDPIKQLFSGTPTQTDGGNITIRVTATDSAGGSSSVDLPMVITFVPTFKSSIPDLSARMDRPFNYSFNNASIENKSGRLTTLGVEMTDGTSPLSTPNWMNFDINTNTLSMVPNSTGIYHFNLVADDGVAREKSLFLVSVTQAQGPIATSARLQDQAVDVNKEFSFQVPPSAFISQDGYPLNFNVKTSANTPWPTWWIHYSITNGILTFTGKPTQKEVNALNSFLGGKPHDFSVFANDGYKTAESSLRITVNGESNVEAGLKYGGLLLSVFSFMFGLYKYRAPIWKRVGKRFYEKQEPVGAVLSESFQYSLSKRSVSCKVIDVNGKELPINEFFNGNLRYDGNNKIINGVPIEKGEFTVVSYNTYGVRSHLFKLNVWDRTELEKDKIEIHVEAPKDQESMKQVTKEKYEAGLFGNSSKQPVKPQVSVDVTEEIEMQPVGESHQGVPRTHNESRALEL